MCVEGTLLVVGPSGIGKSSASIQQHLLWSAGEPAFGITPAKPLKISTIQAEDDAGDLSEIVSGARHHLKLSPEQAALSRKNCTYYHHKALTGHEFLKKIVEPILAKDKPHLLVLNPLQAFLGGDVKDTALVSAFLRNGLNPLLEKYQCAAILVHHTPKTNFRTTDKWRAQDWMYAGAGAADITNHARAVIVMEPTSLPGLFKFIAAKRGSRIGWEDHKGHPETTRYFAWADYSIFWRDATPQEIKQANQEKIKVTPDDLLTLVPLTDTIWKEDLIQQARSSFSIGKHTARDFVDQLVAQRKLFVHKIPRPGNKPEIHLSFNAPSSD